MLKGGAVNANAKDANGTTALMAASYGGHKDIVSLLLDQKADVNAADEENTTALMCAAFRGHGEIVKLLLDKGGDWKVAQPDGWTALAAAKLGGHKEAAKFLEDAGARVDGEFIKKLQKDTAVKIMNELRMVDAAKDQWALENNKTETDLPPWNSLTPYIKTGSKLATSGGNDRLGNPFEIGTVVGRVRINPSSKEALKESTGGDGFWGPYS